MILDTSLITHTQMTYGKKETMAHFRIDKEKASQLDKRIKRMGYKSRAEFFDAVITVTLSEEEEETKQNAILPNQTKQWLKENTPAPSEQQIQNTILKEIDTMLKPAIALKGAKIVFESTCADIRKSVYATIGIWTTDSELLDAYKLYETMHKAELENYRRERLKNQ